MDILLYIAIGYLLITGLILWRNKHDFKPLFDVSDTYFSQQAPPVAICIPARNEADVIERCVSSVINQKYQNLKIWVLDDNSSDGTTEILQKLARTYPEKLNVLSGKPKPEHWIGKAWACKQLAEASDSEIIIFIDADTWLESNAVSRTVRTMGHDVADFVTVWPQQKLRTFWEQTVIPLVYFSLLTLLPVRYIKKSPKWIPSFLRKKTDPLFTAACGQFMAFKRKCYNDIGGHESVKDNVVEDVALAKQVKRHGWSMNMYHGQGTVTCRMYNSGNALWDGFRKNFLAGFNKKIFLFLLMAAIHFLVFVFPFLVAAFAIVSSVLYLAMLSVFAILIMLVQRIVVSQWFNWKIRYCLTHPVGVLWFQILGVRVLLDYINESPVEWKGRTVKI